MPRQARMAINGNTLAGDAAFLDNAGFIVVNGTGELSL